MKIVIKRWPKVVVSPIQSCHETKQFFLLPGLLVGRGYFTVFWITKMMTISFNTTLEWEIKK